LTALTHAEAQERARLIDVGGPDTDSRLRWQILLRLSVLGAASRAEIEHDASRDTTAAGRLSAARCRAALPDRAAKQAAWTAMLGGTLSGYEMAATAQGFWQADQAGLLAGYVPRYFTALAEVAAGGGAEVAWVLCQHGFPHHAERRPRCGRVSGAWRSAAWSARCAGSWLISSRTCAARSR